MGRPHSQRVREELSGHGPQAEQGLCAQARQEAERAIKEAEEAKTRADEAWQRAKQIGSQADAELQQELSKAERVVGERLKLGQAEE